MICPDRRTLKKALNDSPHWATLDDTLYDLCKRYPDHRDVAGTNAKLWLIGRGFGTGIERQIPKEDEESSLIRLCDFVESNHSEIDRIISRIKRHDGRLRSHDLEIIVGAHGAFCRLLRPLMRRSPRTRKKISPRSFVSKYLHFHRPAVPIYDSIASLNLYKEFSWDHSFQIFQKPKEGDWEYYWFVLRFWQLYQGADLTVRQLDQYLFWPRENR